MGVIGGNGTGKTSLLRLIAGEAEPDAGVVRLGDTVKAGLPLPLPYPIAPAPAPAP